MLSGEVWTNTMTEGQEDFDEIYIWGRIHVGSVSAFFHSKQIFASNIKISVSSFNYIDDKNVNFLKGSLLIYINLKCA